MKPQTQTAHPSQPSDPQAIVSVVVDDVEWKDSQLDFMLRSVDIPAPSVASARKLADKIRAHGLVSHNPQAGLIEQRIMPRCVRKITIINLAVYQSWQAGQVEARINAPTDEPETAQAIAV